jgi:hypothetical protein
LYRLFGKGSDHLAASYHIFVKEVLAVCDYVEGLMDAGARGHFIVAEDNTAAKHALNRLYSSNTTANSHIHALATKLLKCRFTLTAIGIRSADNVADTPGWNRV